MRDRHLRAPNIDELEHGRCRCCCSQRLANAITSLRFRLPRQVFTGYNIAPSTVNNTPYLGTGSAGLLGTAEQVPAGLEFHERQTLRSTEQHTAVERCVQDLPYIAGITTELGYAIS